MNPRIVHYVTLTVNRQLKFFNFLHVIQEIAVATLNQQGKITKSKSIKCKLKDRSFKRKIVYLIKYLASSMNCVN